MKNLIFVIGFLICVYSHAQVPSPIHQNYNKILLLNGKAHIGNGKVIDQSAISIEQGKIGVVANALTFKLDKEEWDTIIDISGQQLYPGFIASNATIGLTEIDAVRATNDFREVGYINPHIRSIIAFNLDSKIIYTIRTNGVLVCQATPRGGLISGTSSVMALDGWNWEDAVYKTDDGIHINWPARFRQTGWWAEPGILKKNEKYDEVVETLKIFFKSAQAYLSDNDPVLDLKFEAMSKVFQGNQRVYFHASFAPEMNDIINFSRLFELQFPVIVGGYDAPFLAERLKENKFTIMLSNPHHLPFFEGDLPNSCFSIAFKLKEAGLLFCIQNAGNMEVMNARNLPFLAGTAMAYGLTEEEAIATLTLNPAKIMGLDDRIGSIEKGKDATLFVSSGNALDMRTNHVTMAMVKGRFIALTNHQIQLSEKYSKRYNLK
ncbi:MAG: amidohydrolase family protein [Crocinitomicaceae bacterium]